MSNLKEIADNIINKNFDHALELCKKYQNEKNKPFCYRNCNIC